MEINATTASVGEHARIERWTEEIRARQREQVQALPAILPVKPVTARNTEASPSEPSFDAALASARTEAERKQPRANAEGQWVGTRINTTA